MKLVHRFADSRGRGRLVVWRIAIDERGHEWRRTLLDYLTGEVLDDAWRDRDGATRSWSKGRTDPPAAGDARPHGAEVDRSPEAGCTRRIPTARMRPSRPEWGAGRGRAPDPPEQLAAA
jgi:hypothetical protein